MAKILLFVATLLCILGVSVAQTPAFPKLPMAYSVIVEASIIEDNYSVVMQEYVDFNISSVKFEIQESDENVEYLLDYKKNLIYTVSPNRITCVTSPLNSSTLASLNLWTPTDLLSWGSQYGATPVYQGVSTIRGILCDSWLVSVNVSGGAVWYSFNLQYYFSVANFTENFNATTIPMRATLTGYERYANGSQSPIYHNYEFVGYFNTPPLASEFTISCGLVQETIFVVQNILSTTAGAGLAAGMFFLGLFIGLIAMGVGAYAFRRREKFKAQHSVPLSETADRDH